MASSFNGLRELAAAEGVASGEHTLRASRSQLSEITSLVDSGAIRPVVDRVFPLLNANEALAYVETGRAKGKVVVNVILALEGSATRERQHSATQSGDAGGLSS